MNQIQQIQLFDLEEYTDDDNSLVLKIPGWTSKFSKEWNEENLKLSITGFQEEFPNYDPYWLSRKSN
jgi:hypothetical protein